MDLRYKKQILFAAVFAIILYFGYREDKDSVTNYKRGIVAAGFVLVCQGLLAQYQGPFTKGFEYFWRGVTRYTIIYMVALVFLLFQTASDARQLFKHLYPELGKQVTRGMHTYDDDCDFTAENIWNDLDHYYLMHWVGWFVATLLIRDPYILHFWSLLDEVLELSWQHVLPHFRECWWDHIIVDVLMSNTPAIILGTLFIKKTGLREFDWLGRKGKKSVKEWDVFHNHRRFGCLMNLVMVITSNFLTGFFLINSLWIPPKNSINVYRLTVWFLLGAVTIGELHDDMETYGTEYRRTTPISNEYRWIACAVTILEAVISYKFRHDTGNILNNPTPLYISIPWIVTTISCTGYYLFLRTKPDRATMYGDSAWELAKKQGTALIAEKKGIIENKVNEIREGRKAKKEEQKAVVTEKNGEKDGGAKLTQAGKAKKREPTPESESEPEPEPVQPKKPVENEWIEVKSTRTAKPVATGRRRRRNDS